MSRRVNLLLLLLFQKLVCVPRMATHTTKRSTDKCSTFTAPAGTSWHQTVSVINSTYACAMNEGTPTCMLGPRPSRSIWVVQWLCYTRTYRWRWTNRMWTFLSITCRIFKSSKEASRLRWSPRLVYRLVWIRRWNTLDVDVGLWIQDFIGQEGGERKFKTTWVLFLMGRVEKGVCYATNFDKRWL